MLPALNEEDKTQLLLLLFRTPTTFEAENPEDTKTNTKSPGENFESCVSFAFRVSCQNGGPGVPQVQDHLLQEPQHEASRQRVRPQPVRELRRSPLRQG